MLVGCLDFGNFVYVFEADSAHDVMTWTPSALLYARGFLEKIRGGRGFCDKRERPVRLDGNQGRYGNARFYVCSASVELFAEVHGLHTAGTKSRTDRW